MESLSTFVAITSHFRHIFWPLLAVISVVLICLRTGSSHMFLERIWHFNTVKDDISDPLLRSLLKESHAVSRFNFAYRLNAQTLSDIYKLANWAKANGISMLQLPKVRRWVDISRQDPLILPPKHYIPIHAVSLCSAILLFFSLIIVLDVNKQAYFQMEESTVWFKTDGTIAKAPFQGWSFDQSTCQHNPGLVTKMTGFNPDETEDICTALGKPGLQTQVDQTIKGQKWFLAVIDLLVLIMAISNFNAIRIASQAIKLKRLCLPETKNVCGARLIQKKKVNPA